MFQRPTLILLIVAAALGSTIYWFEIKQEQERGSIGRDAHLLFPGTSPTTIDELAFQTADEFEVRFVRGGEGWRLRSPVDFPAVSSALESMASSLVSLSFDKEIESPEALSVYGLGEQAGLIRFVVHGEERALRMGGLTPVPGHTYVSRSVSKTVSGTEERRVFLLQTRQLNAFHRLFLDLRERHPVSFRAEDVTEIEITGENESLVLAKQEGRWRIASSSLASATGEFAREGVVPAFLDQLGHWRADAFVDQVPPALAQALDREGLSIRLNGKDISLELVVESSKKKEVAVRGAEVSLYLVPAVLIDRLPIKTQNFLDLRVAPFDVSSVRHWELVWHDASGEVASQLIFHVDAEGSDGIEGIEGTWRQEGEAQVENLDEEIQVWLQIASELSGTGIYAEGLNAEGRRGLGLEPGNLCLRVWGENMGPEDLLADLRMGNSLLSHSVSDNAGRVLMMNAMGESVYGVSAEVSAVFAQKAESFRRQR